MPYKTCITCVKCTNLYIIRSGIGRFPGCPGCFYICSYALDNHLVLSEISLELANSDPVPGLQLLTPVRRDVLFWLNLPSM